MKIFNLNFNNDFQKLIIPFVFVIFMISLVLIVLFRPRIVDEQPLPDRVPLKETQKEVIIESSEGDVILYESVDGKPPVLESTDSTLTEEEARKEIGIPEDQEVEYYIPAAAGPRAITQEDIDKEYEEEWGVPPEWGD